MRVIIIGGGEVTFFLARTFLSKGHQVSVISSKLEECENLSRNLKALVIHGDASDPRILEDARAREANLLIAVSPYDHINLVCCQTGSLLFNIPRTLALVNDPDNYEIYKQLGIDHVFNQTQLIVSMLEKNIEYDNISPIISYGEGKILINEVTVTAKMPIYNLRLGDLSLPEDARILGIVRVDVFKSPSSDLKIEKGDKIILLTSPDIHAPTIRAICGEEA